VGAIIGGIFFSRRGKNLNHPALITSGVALFGLGLVGSGCFSTLGLAIASMVIVGFGIMIMMAGSNMTLILLSDPDKHGRVLSLFTLSYAVASPIGSVSMGCVANAVGARSTLVLSGLVCIAATLIFCREVPAIGRRLREGAGSLSPTA
jgi:predicted MFS family arabinose efflux permease